jgi:ribosomal protein L11 methyltransferase
MIKASFKFSSVIALQLEHHLFEFAPHKWVLLSDPNENDKELVGYFSSKKEAKTSFKDIFRDINEINSDILIFDKVDEEDWQNSYKKHFHPWNINGFHWVPIWEKNTYKIPSFQKKIFLDPGMAFGTGNHETTKLCLKSMIECDEKTIGNYDSFADFGCGSGILALTACMIGFNNVYGMDIDEDAVKVSYQNAKLNNIENVKFEQRHLNEVKKNKGFDFIVANIQADILIENSSRILEHLKKKGILVLSGILEIELKDVLKHFLKEIKSKSMTAEVESHTLNEWASVKFFVNR